MKPTAWKLMLACALALGAAACDDGGGGSGADTDTDTDTDADAGEDASTDSDSDTDSDTDSDSDGDADDCTPDETATLAVGDMVTGEADTTGMGNSLDVSCDVDPNTGAQDYILAVEITEPGDLVLNGFNPTYTQVFGFYPAMDTAADCPATGDEIACYDPYNGPSQVFAGIAAGSYLMVLRDWDAANSGSGSASWYLTLYPEGGEICNDGADNDGDDLADCDDTDCAAYTFCLPEDCANGVDDNLDGAIDCLDLDDCADAAECTGSTCAADNDLGLLVPLTAYPVSFDTTTDGADNFDMPCAPTAGGVEYVISFTLDVEARMQVDLTQAAADDHSLGTYVEGGADDGCVDWALECIPSVVQTVTGAYLYSGGVFPPGEYYTVMEVVTNPGPVDLVFTAEPVCDTGYLWDPDLYECAPWECTTVDLGTFDGTPIAQTADTCDGTSLFGATGDFSCTGYPAASTEAIFSLTVPAGEAIDVTLTPDSGNTMDTSLYILSDCLDFDQETCLAGADATLGGEAESVSYTNTGDAEQIVYIYADAYAGCGAVTLDVE